jgi:hypothetical protein
MFKQLVCAASIALFISTAAAHATPITYDYTLIPTSGSTGGNLVLNLTTTPTQTYANYASDIGPGSEAIIGGQIFNLTTASVLEFTNLSGSIYDITYAGTVGGSTLDLTGGYAFYQTGQGPVSSGMFSAATVGPNAVPEPLTLSLFGAGLAGAAALRRRKKAKQT